MSSKKIITKEFSQLANTYVGRTGEVWFQEGTTTLRFGNNTTPGGVPMSGGTGSSLEYDGGGGVENDAGFGLSEDHDFVIRLNAQASPQDQTVWAFDENGRITLPAGGDIVNSQGNSVLGGNIPSTLRGFINLVGDRPNNDNDVWFESVLVRGSYIYALGGDNGYISNSNSRTKVYKFDVMTGEQIWVKQIAAGRNARFDISVGSDVATLDGIPTAGIDYKVGEEIVIEGSQIGGNTPANNVVLLVATINGSGGILTATVKPGYDVVGISGTYTELQAPYEDANGNPICLGYDELNDLLLVVAQIQPGQGNSDDNYWSWANLYGMDPDTGAIVETATLSEEGDINANSITTFNAENKIAIVGEKYNEYREFGTLTMLATGNGYFDILKSNLDPEHYPDAPFNPYYEFWITGTGITNKENVDDVNYYPTLATTVQQGSGAVFTVDNDGFGTYGVTITSAGTNYLAGHKILILGTALGGASPANDAIITVMTANGGQILVAEIAGTAPGSTPTQTVGATGTNHNVGTNATFIIRVDVETGAFTYGGISNQGSNYVAGDVITIPGTSFAGGVSPTNDIAIVVASVDGSGLIGSILGEPGGQGPTTALRIQVNGVDFRAVGGSWSMLQNLGGEAFVWTPTWTNAIGGPTGDRFYDACYNADGTALYAVGRGRYEVNYDQALVVKFDAEDGSILWSTDIKFEEAGSANRQARAVCLAPDNSDIMVGGEWYNDDAGRTEIILTRMDSSGAAVWQQTYSPYIGGEFNQRFEPDGQLAMKSVGSNIVVTFQQTTQNDTGIAYMMVDADDGSVIRHRVVYSDGNADFVGNTWPTPNYMDVFANGIGDEFVVIGGKTDVPTNNDENALLMRLPLDGLKSLDVGEKLSLGEHTMTHHDVTVTTVTPAFDSFTADQHLDTITTLANARDYKIREPDAELGVWTFTITDDSMGYLEFGDGSRQSFATHVIPQIPAANDYYLTEQDSGKHIFFELENGWVYIPHWTEKNLPVGFTFTIVNTTGSDCWVETQSIDGPQSRARLKLAGRNINTVTIGIPDSGSGSMVTFLKVKQGYYMPNSDGNQDYPDVWMVSGPGDIYDND